MKTHDLYILAENYRLKIDLSNKAIQKARDNNVAIGDPQDFSPTNIIVHRFKIKTSESNTDERIGLICHNNPVIVFTGENADDPNGVVNVGQSGGLSDILMDD
jgi:hypothetical protein